MSTPSLLALYFGSNPKKDNFYFGFISLNYKIRLKIFLMLNLYFISDAFNGFSIGFLNVITIISFFSGIFIIITKNPIISVLYLILLFSSISCYLIFIGINFIGISYLLV